jgi:hypothetical protein
MVGRVQRLGLGLVMVLAVTAACSSDKPRTEVKGEVLTRDNYGGPSPAVAEFRAGERAVYGR